MPPARWRARGKGRRNESVWTDIIDRYAPDDLMISLLDTPIKPIARPPPAFCRPPY
ncbi:Protein CBG26908 [Caenorhabditis briggsae]|uniref:Protein CBG26908 n=1 Tax=Caenorhabditis briggsae TaxID=6238 RepID=B6IEW6_CAEBR|nr:Protein CBG26908 [Caenorhabditis briggsae]CAR98446.1 Protein CBG26908 [Caenorhabditis briggsae]